MHRSKLSQKMHVQMSNVEDGIEKLKIRSSGQYQGFCFLRDSEVVTTMG